MRVVLKFSNDLFCEIITLSGDLLHNHAINQPKQIYIQPCVSDHATFTKIPLEYFQVCVESIIG